MFRAAAVSIVVVALAAQSIVSGLWTHRWASKASIDAIVSATQLPMVAGEWDGTEQPVAAAEVKLSQAIAITRRIYVDRRSGNAVSAMLVAGHGGPIAVHTPEVCFPTNGYELIVKPARFKLSGDDTSEFWHSRFVKPSAGAIPLSVFYAWSDGGKWQAAEQPRVAFADRAALYKLYLVIERTSGVDSEVDDSARDLLRALLPQLTISQ